jgi:hypothetical protein
MRRSFGSFKLFIGKRTDRNYGRRMLADFLEPGSMPGEILTGIRGGVVEKGAAAREGVMPPLPGAVRRWLRCLGGRRAASQRATPTTLLLELEFPSTLFANTLLQVGRPRFSQCRSILHCFGVGMPEAVPLDFALALHDPGRAWGTPP